MNPCLSARFEPRQDARLAASCGNPADPVVQVQASQIRNHTLQSDPIDLSIAVLLLFQVCALFGRSLVQTRLEQAGVPREIAADLSWPVTPLVLGTLMIPVVRTNRLVISAMFHFDNVDRDMLIRAIALGLLLRLAWWGALTANAAFQLYMPDVYAPVSIPQIGYGCPSYLAMLLGILVSAMLTPIVEEFLNRGLVLQRLLPHGRTTAILGSAVLFGMLHHPQTIGPASVIGVFLAIQYLNTRSLWAPIVTHATYNLLVIVDSHCIQVAWIPDSVTPANTLIGAHAVSLLLASLIACGQLVRPRI